MDASVPGFLCQSGRRRPENVSILSSLVVQRRQRKCPKKRDARQLLFCQSKPIVFLVFFAVLVAVAVVVG